VDRSYLSVKTYGTKLETIPGCTALISFFLQPFAPTFEFAAVIVFAFSINRREESEVFAEDAENNLNLGHYLPGGLLDPMT
jgi:hypothetical protein